MQFDRARSHRSHGSGRFTPESFARLGEHAVFEDGVLVFHPETIEIGDNVYVGHNTMLKGYHNSRFTIGDHSWIGQGCFLHSAGGLHIGRAVGIGPLVKILTSTHRAGERDVPVLFADLAFAPVTVHDGSDIGVGAIVLPGVTVGEGAIVGAGSVVTRDIPAYEVWAGVPAARLRSRL
jgi:acetyltransferase-like isoleucine patch superfamily enzyme